MRASVTLTLLAAVLACPRSDRPISDGRSEGMASLEVIEAVISEYLTPSEHGPAVVVARTSLVDRYERPHEFVESSDVVEQLNVSQTLVYDFLRANQQPLSISTVRGRVRLVAPSDVARRVGESPSEYWQRIWKDFGDRGFWVFAAPAIGSDAPETALMYIENMRGPRDARGIFLLLRREPIGRWIVVATHEVPIA